MELRREIVHSYDLNFQHFGIFTYVTIVDKSKVSKFSDDKRVGKNVYKEQKKAYCISKDLYEAHKGHPFFFLDRVTRENQFEAVSSKFYKAYQEGIGWKIDFVDWHIDLLNALKNGKFDRIVKNHYHNNHTLLNHKDEIIYHCVRIDYINGQLTEKNRNSEGYDIDKLAKYLKSRKDIKNLDVIHIPYYNADFYNQRAVEFTYVPPKNKWKDFVWNYYPDITRGKFGLIKKLGIYKFREGE